MALGATAFDTALATSAAALAAHRDPVSPTWRGMDASVTGIDSRLLILKS
jgi:hypothetical protein